MNSWLRKVMMLLCGNRQEPRLGPGRVMAAVGVLLVCVCVCVSECVYVYVGKCTGACFSRSVHTVNARARGTAHTFVYVFQKLLDSAFRCRNVNAYTYKCHCVRACVCVCVLACLFLYVYLLARMYVFICVYLCVCVCGCVNNLLLTSAHTRVRVCVCWHVYLCMSIYQHACICVFVYVLLTSAHIRVRVCVPACIRASLCDCL